MRVSFVLFLFSFGTSKAPSSGMAVLAETPITVSFACIHWDRSAAHARQADEVESRSQGDAVLPKCSAMNEAISFASSAASIL